MKIKSIFKRSLAVVLALMMLLTSGIVSAVAANVDLAPTGANIPAGTKLYLTPNNYWKQNNPRYAAYFFGTGEAWVSMTAVSGKTDLYEVTTPSGGTWTKVIFCRMNPSATANNWDNKWNQTSDLVYDGTKNHYTVKASTWDKGVGTWDTYTPSYIVNKAEYGLTGIEGTVKLGDTTITKADQSMTAGTYDLSIAAPNGYNISYVKVWGGTETTEGTTGTSTYSGKVNLNAPTTIRVDYVAAGYSYTVTAGEGGTVSPAGSGTGTSVEVTAQPNEGYTFAGWETTNGSVTDAGSASTTFTPTANDAIVTATFKKLTYTVTFVDHDDTVIDTQTVEHGESATAPAAPTHDGFTFIGWDGDYDNVTSDLTIKAICIEIKYVTYTFKDYDGTVLATGEIVAGNTPTAPQDPTREGYNFIGWNPAVGVITDDVTYTALYDIKTYTVTFLGKDGETLSTETVNHGSAATAPENTAVQGYTFDGWDKSFDNITADTTVTAQYTANTYTVSVNNTVEGGEASTSLSSVTYPNTVTLTATPSTQYVFTGWTIEGEYEEDNIDLTKTDITITPLDNLKVTPSFAEGQKLTVYTYSEDGLNKLTLTEDNGTETKTPIDGVTQQEDAADFYGTTWDKSTQVDLTHGYFNSVTAQLTGNGSGKLYNNGKYLITEGYRTIVFTNGWAWSQPRIYAWKGTSTYYEAWPGSNMEYACNNSSDQGVYVFQIPNEYTKVIFSGKNQKDQQTGNITLPSGSNDLVAYYINGGTGNTPTVEQWDIQPDTYTPNSDIIELKDVLYKDGAWAGNTEVWIYQDGSDAIVTTRRNLFNLIDGKTELYNTDNADGTYTADSWTNFVNAYDDAVAAAGNKTAQQSAIDSAETALQDAFDALELQNYFTVTVNQSQAGTVAIGNDTVTDTVGTVNVPEGKEVTVTVKAPKGMYVQQIMVNAEIVFEGNERNTTADYKLTNVTEPKSIFVTYASREDYTIKIDAYNGEQGKLYYDSEYTQEVPAAGDTVTVYTGDNFTVYAKPADNYAVESWQVGTQTKPSAPTCMLTNISANHTISVKWAEREEVSVSIKANPNYVATVTATSGDNTATNTGTNSFTILEGKQVTLTAGTISDTRFKFNGWVIKGDYTLVSGGTSAEELVIKANGNLEITANYTQVYRRIYLENAAKWTQPYIYVWGGSSFTAWPGDKMKDDPSSDYWYFDVPMDITNIQFNDGINQNVINFYDVSNNLYNNSTKTSSIYIEPGYYLQGTWNGYNYSAYDQVKFDLDTDGNYLATITVTSTEDGYIYVNPTDENSNLWEPLIADSTDNRQYLTKGTYTTTPKQLKVEIDTANTDKAYDVTFTFNPTTGYFAWTVAENIPTITIIGTDGRTTDDGQNKADQNIVTNNYRIGDTYFDLNTVLSAEAYKEISEKATAHAGESVSFYTQVKPTTAGNYIYYVAGWVVNGTEFVHATNLGNGKYMGSYTFTQQENSFVPVYFHTQEWLTDHNAETVTVYAVTDLSITNWDTYISAYTWYKVGGVRQYEQFGRYSGQVMIPVTGLDNVYYTIVEYGTKDNIQISGITFNNYATSTQSKEDGGKTNDVIVNSYSNIQTYDYYEFISLLNDGKENITFVLKNTNDTQNDDKVGEKNINIGNNWNFVQYTDYSGLRTDIFGNNIEEKEKNNELSDDNALYIVQAGDREVTNHQVLDGQWYVECYLYDSTGKYLGKCYSYELHDKESDIWGELADYENQRAYISYEVGRPYDETTRYDGEWYGDADVSVTINLAVNVGLMGNDGYTVDTTDPVNDADYGYANINATEQNVNVERGKTVTLSAKPKTGYKFVGWYSADGTLFSTNISDTVIAAVGTTYTAVFEELDQGKFYVNHYIYKGIGDSDNIPQAHGGDAVLYVGIENATQETNTTLLKDNSASIDVREGDVLYITIATDATGEDYFYSWYTDAFDIEGKTTFEEVGVDSDDNLYDNNGTVIGRKDTVYYKFKYVWTGDTKIINLYSDLMHVSVNSTLLYSYTDRYGQAKTVKVPIVLTNKEVDGFEGNNFKPYTPAYISGDGWINTVQANAPFVDGYYDDIAWVINDTMYDEVTFEIRATQSKKKYTVTIYSGPVPVVSTCLYNEIITLDATELFGGESGKGFWYEDVNGDGFDETTDKIITYNAFYGYRVTSDICLGYEKIEDEMKFDVTLDAPVYSREQETDKASGDLVDKVYVDYMINIITPHLYGQEGWTEDPIYKGETIKDNWNGAHVTLESYVEKTGAKLEYGVIVQQFGATIPIGEDKTFAEAEAEAIGRGYQKTDDNDDNLIATLQSEDGQIVVDGKVAYKKYEANNHPTNFNRVLFTVYYSNTPANQGKFFNAYGYIKVTDAEGNVKYYFSNAQYHNIYNTGTSTVSAEA